MTQQSAAPTAGRRSRPQLAALRKPASTATLTFTSRSDMMSLPNYLAALAGVPACACSTRTAQLMDSAAQGQRSSRTAQLKDSAAQGQRSSRTAHLKDSAAQGQRSSRTAQLKDSAAQGQRSSRTAQLKDK